MEALSGVRVLDLSGNLSGAYCTKLLADVGATVVAVDDGNGLGSALAPGHATFALDRDSRVAAYLRQAHVRVQGEDTRAKALAQLAHDADIVVESGALSPADVDALRAAAPAIVVVSIRPFGTDGTWAARPATEFSIQALCGSSIYRGFADRGPLYAAGRISEWLTGGYAAVATLGALRGAAVHGIGEHVDVALTEVAFLCFTLFQNVQQAMGGPEPGRGVSIPSIEQASDGYVGFSVNTPDHFRAYTDMLGRPELADLPGILVPQQRQQYRDAMQAAADAWLSGRTRDEAVRLAADRRIPVAPVNTVPDLTTVPHFQARELFIEADDGLLAPRPPFLVDGRALSPARGATVDDLPPWPARTEWRESTDAHAASPLPLRGIRVVDLTAWWAGPCATQLLSALGAEVVKVESHTRYDGMRDVTARGRKHADWWEWSWQYQAVNTDKAGVTLDMTQPDARAVLDRLLEDADVLIENGSPGVMGKLGLDWEDLHARHPRLTFVRMPAFGLSGPWMEMRGFDPTAAQATGLASLNGYAGDRPISARGFCDDTAGVHAAFATLAALEETRRSGVGHHIESAMSDVVVGLLAEHLLEYQRTGEAPQRDGNHGPFAAPQGIYACAGEEQWLAIAVTTDEQWAALCDELGSPAWALDSALRTDAGRRAHHDVLDRELAATLASQDADTVAARLRAAGIPAERLLTPAEAFDSEQFRARGFAEKLDHRVVGTQEYPSLPFRYGSRRNEPWFREPSPTMGEHTSRVLTEIAGLSVGDVADLAARGITGTQPA